jgi:hypothetical protein
VKPNICLFWVDEYLSSVLGCADKYSFQTNNRQAKLAAGTKVGKTAKRPFTQGFEPGSFYAAHL